RLPAAGRHLPGVRLPAHLRRGDGGPERRHPAGHRPARRAPGDDDPGPSRAVARAPRDLGGRGRAHGGPGGYRAVHTEAMKVGLVSPYDYTHPGGVTEHIRHLGNWLRQLGHEVRTFAPSSRPTAEREIPEFYRIGRVFPVPGNDSVARIT